MTYELALQLRDAGFPQKFGKTKANYGKLVYIFGLKGLRIRPRPTEKQYNQMVLVGLEVVCLPSLEELIEALGKYKGFHLENEDNGEWFAVCRFGEFPDVDWQKGSTPEKAVANLWLAINKK